MVIYKFVDIEGNILYIGKTENVYRRMKQHFNGKGHLPKECYDNVFEIYYIEVDGKTNLDIYETYMINKYLPKYNTDKKFNEDIEKHTANDFIQLNESNWSKLYFRYREKGIEVSEKPFSYAFFDRNLMEREKCEELLKYNYYLIKKQNIVFKKYMPIMLDKNITLLETLLKIHESIFNNTCIKVYDSCFDEPLNKEKNDSYEWVAFDINILTNIDINIKDVMLLVSMNLLMYISHDVYGIVALTPYVLTESELSFRKLVRVDSTGGL